MEQIIYQRPREKLRDKGVGSLSTTELLQIIISSGNKGASAARIAKSIVSLFEEQKRPVLYGELLKVPGLGSAKAAQIIAAIEVGDRLRDTFSGVGTEAPSFPLLKTASKRALEYVTVDGAGKHIQGRTAHIPEANLATVSIRKMFADALHDYANSLIVGIGFRSHSLDILEGDTLSIVKMIYDTASLLEIRLDTIWLVNKTTQRAITRKVLE